MKVVLLNAPSFSSARYIKEGICQGQAVDMAWPPVTLATIGSLLQRIPSVVVKLIDGNLLRMSARQLEEACRDFPPDVVIITTTTSTYPADARAAAVVRSVNPEVFVVMIGPHSSACAEEIVSAGEADVVVKNEPELTTVSLLKAMLGNLPWRTVPGIVFGGNKGAVTTSPAELIADLDLLPPPARELLDNQKYIHPLTGQPFSVIQASRGCPYNCSFCCEFYYGSRWRSRSPSVLVAEMQDCVETFGIRDFLMCSNNFTFDRGNVLAFCRELRERACSVTWTCNSRVDTVDAEMLARMKEAGCTMITYGIESSDRRILAQVGKKITPEQAQRAVTLTKKHGIAALGHFLFGLPGETRETAEANIRFASALNPDYAEFLVATPYPGTEFSRCLQAEGRILSEDWSRYDETRCDVYAPPGFKRGDLPKLVRKAYLRFYFRPGRLLNEVSRCWQTGGFRGIFSLGRLFWQRYLC